MFALSARKTRQSYRRISEPAPGRTLDLTPSHDISLAECLRRTAALQEPGVRLTGRCSCVTRCLCVRVSRSCAVPLFRCVQRGASPSGAPPRSSPADSRRLQRSVHAYAKPRGRSRRCGKVESLGSGTGGGAARRAVAARWAGCGGSRRRHRRAAAVWVCSSPRLGGTPLPSLLTGRNEGPHRRADESSRESIAAREALTLQRRRGGGGSAVSRGLL